MRQKCKMAYTEVLEILKHIPKEEVIKIPKSTIDFFERNRDESYYFTYDVSKTLVEQNILRETNSIIVTLYKDYFANENEKEKIDIILNNNEKKHENELREKYKVQDLFKRYKSNSMENEKKSQMLIEYKELYIKKIIKKLKKLLKIS